MRILALARCALIALGVLRSAPAQEPITRSQALATAEQYLRIEWTPTERNAFHGKDPDGVRVDTPDAAYASKDSRPGWWMPRKTNVGMPYQWGGFCSPEEFLRGIREGKYAGDVYTAEKRKLLDAAVSRHAVGIDCSGFISRCWGLQRSYSTRELPALCHELGSFDELRPGDILNTHNNHVLLFREFRDAAGARLLAYEAGSPPTWKVLLNDIPVTKLRAEGYRPWRYKQIRDR